MSTTPRYRERGAFTNKAFVLNAFNTDGTSTQSVAYAPSGTREWMHDSVSRPFIPGVTLANTLMSRLQETKTVTPMTGSQTFNNPNASGVTHLSGEVFLDCESDFGTLIRETSNYDYTSLVTQACTRALARVQKPEVAGLVAIAEARRTLHSLLHPIDGILSFLSRNAKKRRRGKARTRDNVNSMSDLSDQHLTIIFGIRPFVEDIKGILKALEKLEPVPVRFTARGEQSAVDSQELHTDYVTYSDSNTLVKMFKDVKVTRTVTVRAYQAYESDLSLTDALGLNFQSIPVSMWQTMSLSFLVDWFVNVSDVISALTPRVGVRYLHSGYTKVIVDACEATTRNRCYAQPGAIYSWVGGYEGGSQTRVTVAKSRVPCSLFGHIAPGRKDNMHKDLLDTFKVTAALSLLTQRLRGFL